MVQVDDSLTQLLHYQRLAMRRRGPTGRYGDVLQYLQIARGRGSRLLNPWHPVFVWVP